MGLEKGDWEELLEEIYPIGIHYNVSIFNFEKNPTLEKVKEMEKNLPLPGKWKFIGCRFYNLIFERIK